MNKLNFLLSLSLAAFFFVSCSSDDSDPEVVFTAMTANKTDVFIEDPITINLEGTGYTDVNVTSNNGKIKIKKVSNTVYEISSTEATTGGVYAELKNNTYHEVKSVNLNFAEHGVKNFKTIEGITVKTDKSDKLLRLLGEPNQKINSTSGSTEYWRYSSKGLSFNVTKSSSIVDAAYAYSSNFYIVLENSEILNYTSYTYGIGNEWKINSTNMDAVINTLGAPTTKYSSTTDPNSTLRTYLFANQNLYISFFSASVDDYAGKAIKSIIVF